MDISVEQLSGKNVPVTVMKLTGELDATSYLDVIGRAQTLYQAGTRDLLLDLSDLSFMSSSGLVALHSIAMLMRGQKPLDPSEGWSVMHEIANQLEKATGFEEHCKLLRPQPRVEKTLKVAGFDRMLQSFASKESALAAF